MQRELPVAVEPLVFQRAERQETTCAFAGVNGESEVSTHLHLLLLSLLSQVLQLILHSFAGWA